MAPAGSFSLQRLQRARAMPYQNDFDRRNDIRLLTPLLLMAVIIAVGVLVWAYTGHALAASG